MRLRIGLHPASSETRLRVLCQNVGAVEQDLVISDDFDNLSFTVTAPPTERSTRFLMSDSLPLPQDPD